LKLVVGCIRVGFMPLRMPVQAAGSSSLLDTVVQLSKVNFTYHCWSVHLKMSSVCEDQFVDLTTVFKRLEDPAAWTVDRHSERHIITKT